MQNLFFFAYTTDSDATRLAVLPFHERKQSLWSNNDPLCCKVKLQFNSQQEANKSLIYKKHNIFLSPLGCCIALSDELLRLYP